MFFICIYNIVNECWNMEFVIYCIINIGMKIYYTLSNLLKLLLNFFFKIILFKKFILINYFCIEFIYIFLKKYLSLL